MQITTILFYLQNEFTTGLRLFYTQYAAIWFRAKQSIYCFYLGMLGSTFTQNL